MKEIASNNCVIKYGNVTVCENRQILPAIEPMISALKLFVLKVMSINHLQNNFFTIFSGNYFKKCILLRPWVTVGC